MDFEKFKEIVGASEIQGKIQGFVNQNLDFPRFAQFPLNN